MVKISGNEDKFSRLVSGVIQRRTLQFIPFDLRHVADLELEVLVLVNRLVPAEGVLEFAGLVICNVVELLCN